MLRECEVLGKWTKLRYRMLRSCFGVGHGLRRDMSRVCVVLESQSWHPRCVGGVVRGIYSIGRMLRGRSGVKAAESEPETGTSKAAHEGEASSAELRHARFAARSVAKGDDGLLTQGLVLVVLLLVSFATQIRLLPRTRSASLPWNSSHPLAPIAVVDEPAALVAAGSLCLRLGNERIVSDYLEMASCFRFERVGRNA